MFLLLKLLRTVLSNKTLRMHDGSFCLFVFFFFLFFFLVLFSVNSVMSTRCLEHGAALLNGLHVATFQKYCVLLPGASI